jgi:hypothetical protein
MKPRFYSIKFSTPPSKIPNGKCSRRSRFTEPARRSSKEVSVIALTNEMPSGDLA